MVRADARSYPLARRVSGRQAGSEQTLTTCPRFPPSITMASAIFSQGFWLAGSLVLAPFAFGFLISNSTY